MKTILGALALVLAVPVAAQIAPAADPHAGHAQHGQQHKDMTGHNHAKMMDECKKAIAEGKCAEHCKVMMEKHGAAAKAADASKANEGHAH